MSSELEHQVAELRKELDTLKKSLITDQSRWWTFQLHLEHDVNPLNPEIIRIGLHRLGHTIPYASWEYVTDRDIEGVIQTFNRNWETRLLWYFQEVGLSDIKIAKSSKEIVIDYKGKETFGKLCKELLKAETCH